jgi:HEAT repeat protein
MADLGVLERCLGAMGTAFRLVRYYPGTHPAVQEAMRNLSTHLPGVATLGTVEWQVGATGMHWRGQHLLPRNSQLSELASLLFARGVRAIQLNPGVTPEQVLALYGVATGTIAPDDASLGRVAVQTNRRSVTPRATGAHLFPSMTDRIVPAPEAPHWQTGQPMEGRRSTATFKPDVLPADVECRRLLASLLTAESPEGLRGTAQRLQALIPEVVQLRDLALLAEIIAGLDKALARIEDPATIDTVGAIGEALAPPPMIDRLVSRLGESRIPPTERGFLVGAVGALASLSVGPLLRAYRQSPAELREPYRAAIRVAADRAMEPLKAAIDADDDDAIVAAAAHFLGLTGSPDAIPVLASLMRHSQDAVREAALYAMAEIGGKETARPAVAALRDRSAAVRAAATRVLAVGADPTATGVLLRRLEQEEDEGVLAGILTAVGRLAAPEALAVLAKYAEPGGFLKRRTPHLRAAAIEGIGHIPSTEARALLELYSHDKEPTVRRAAEAALQ